MLGLQSKTFYRTVSSSRCILVAGAVFFFLMFPFGNFFAAWHYRGGVGTWWKVRWLGGEVWILELSVKGFLHNCKWRMVWTFSFIRAYLYCKLINNKRLPNLFIYVVLNRSGFTPEKFLCLVVTVSIFSFAASLCTERLQKVQCKELLGCRIELPIPLVHVKNITLLIGASRPLTGSPMDLLTFFFVCVFFFSPSAAKNGIPGGQTHGRKPWIDLIF